MIKLSSRPQDSQERHEILEWCHAIEYPLFDDCAVADPEDMMEITLPKLKVALSYITQTHRNICGMVNCLSERNRVLFRQVHPQVTTPQRPIALSNFNLQTENLQSGRLAQWQKISCILLIHKKRREIHEIATTLEHMNDM